MIGRIGQGDAIEELVGKGEKGERGWRSRVVVHQEIGKIPI